MNLRLKRLCYRKKKKWNGHRSRRKNAGKKGGGVKTSLIPPATLEKGGYDELRKLSVQGDETVGAICMLRSKSKTKVWK